MMIYLDGKEIATGEAKGNIRRTFYPVTIGKNHERDHENRPGPISNAVFDEVMIHNEALDPGLLGWYQEKPVDTRNILLWLPFEEFRLPFAVAKPKLEAHGQLEIEEQEDKILITANRFRYVFNKLNGRLSHITYEGKDFLSSGPRLNVSRPPIVNEISVPDRKTGAKTGIYTIPIEEIKMPYIIPQEFGNNTDVRWAIITHKKGNGLAFISEDVMNISVNPYSNLSSSWYPYQLKRKDKVTLNIDHRVSGVGGTPITVRHAYRAYPDEYHYRIRIKSISASQNETTKMARQV